MYKQALVNILLKQAADYRTMAERMADTGRMLQNPEAYFNSIPAKKLTPETDEPKPAAALTPETRAYSQQDMYDAVQDNYNTRMEAVNSLRGKYQAEYDKRIADDDKYTEDARNTAMGAGLAAALGGTVLGGLGGGLSYIGGDYLNGGFGTGIKPKVIAGTALAGAGGLAGYGLARSLGYGKKGRIVGTLLGSAGLPVLSSLAAAERIPSEVLPFLGMGAGALGSMYLAQKPFRKVVDKRKAETEAARQSYNNELNKKRQEAEDYLAEQSMRYNFD